MLKQFPYRHRRQGHTPAWYHLIAGVWCGSWQSPALQKRFWNTHRSSEWGGLINHLRVAGTEMLKWRDKRLQRPTLASARWHEKGQQSQFGRFGLDIRKVAGTGCLEKLWDLCFGETKSCVEKATADVIQVSNDPPSSQARYLQRTLPANMSLISVRISILRNQIMIYLNPSCSVLGLCNVSHR